jgi:sporulation protein YlmC with PRC-barrel domain
MVRAKRFVGAAVASWVVLGAASLAAAQAPPPPRTTTAAPERDAGTSKPLRAKEILGAKVSLKGDTSVGTVDDIVFDRDGRVDYLLVNKGGKYVVVPWQAANFNIAQRTATVNITPQQFQQVPTYTSGQWPNFYDQTFRTQTYNYYGLRPGQERRLERREGRR